VPETVEKVRRSYVHVGLVFPPSNIWRFPELLLRALYEKKRVFETDCNDYMIAEGLPSHRDSTVKAWLPVMYGCNNFCSYCIIPYIRGQLESRSSSDILTEARKIAESGVLEIVIAGINIASFGIDTGESLINLLKGLCAINELKRVRFSSLDCSVITSDFIDAISNMPKICDHFHLSLQSGSDKTLTSMNRKYTTETYATKVEMLRQAYPNAGITTDIIVGFPNESDTDFNITMDFIKHIGFSRLHVFPFSPKKGTKAAELPNQVASSIKNDRAKRLISLGDELADKYLMSQIGKTLSVLFEESNEGYSTNYITVKSDNAKPNQIASVLITEAKYGKSFGIIIM
jgi:threonylcarbamoyladenosine tRNA methylthiotransferase MtaB